MRFLLDTHTFLWFVTNDMKLGEKARQLISEPTNQIFISPATYWEVAIKVSIGKYPLTVPFEVFFNTALEENSFSILPIGINHAAVLASLPMHHRDPFDRMIIAQSIAEKIPVISSDAQFDSYNLKRI